MLREADAIFIQELRAADLYDQVSQTFAVYLPVKSVGVVGDARRYEHVIALRAVATIDFMTARWAHLPYEFIERVSNRIINEISGVSRVVYDVSSKPPSTIEWANAKNYYKQQVYRLLRKAKANIEAVEKGHFGVGH